MSGLWFFISSWLSIWFPSGCSLMFECAEGWIVPFGNRRVQEHFLSEGKKKKMIQSLSSLSQWFQEGWKSGSVCSLFCVAFGCLHKAGMRAPFNVINVWLVKTCKEKSCNVFWFFFSEELWIKCTFGHGLLSKTLQCHKPSVPSVVKVAKSEFLHQLCFHINCHIKEKDYWLHLLHTLICRHLDLYFQLQRLGVRFYSWDNLDRILISSSRSSLKNFL